MSYKYISNYTDVIMLGNHTIKELVMLCGSNEGDNDNENG